MDEYEQAIEHEKRRQLAAMAQCPAAQFIPGIPETPEQRYLRRLEECGAGPKALAKNWEDLKSRHPWLADLS